MTPEQIDRLEMRRVKAMLEAAKKRPHLKVAKPSTKAKYTKGAIQKGFGETWCVWMVPPEERPKGWENLGIKEKDMK